MGLSKEQILAMDARRRQVAGLYLRGVRKGQMAEVLNVDCDTITNDIKWLKTAWRRELVDDPVAVKARELAALDALEREAAAKYAATGFGTWWDRRLRAMERRAKLLGLDAAIRIDIALQARRAAEAAGLDPDEVLAEAQAAIDRAGLG